MNRNIAGTLLALLAAGGYAFFPIFAKWAYESGVTTNELLIWRFILAASIFWLSYPLWRKQSRLNALSLRDILTLLGLGALFSIAALAAFNALAEITATTYTILFNTTPTLVALLNAALGERLPTTTWLAIGLGVIGCALTAGGALDVSSTSGVVFVMINAVVIATYLVTAGRYTRHIPGLTSGLMVITGAMLALLVYGVFRGFSAPASLNGWLAILGMSTVSTVVAIAATLGGVAYIGASRASALSTAGPPFTIALAAIILGDSVEPIQYAGGVLILTSILLIHWRDFRPSPEPVTDPTHPPLEGASD